MCIPCTQTADHVPVPEQHTAKASFYRLRLKRFIDVVVSLIAILLAAVPMLIITVVNAMLYRRVFFIEPRIGRDGKQFRMIKFLSMIDGKNTRFGAFLRYTALDELPQLFHVLVGTMSLVGPRPHTVEQFERMSAICGYTARNSIRPGMTGFSQLRGHYDCDETRAQLILSDAEYLERCSFWVDVGILFRTLAVFFTGH